MSFGTEAAVVVIVEGDWYKSTEVYGYDKVW